MIQAPVALLNTHLVTVDGAVGIDPGSLIVTGRFNYKSVAFPKGGRISVPTRLCFRSRQLASVRPKVAPYAVPLEELHEFVLKLHESVVTVVLGAGETRRVALEQRIIPIFLILVKSKSQRRISGGGPGLAPLL